MSYMRYIDKTTAIKLKNRLNDWHKIQLEYRRECFRKWRAKSRLPQRTAP